jgi:alkanesulfonate monooxygenase SsuD/methylene tetrahydromethanopterin reductase-like flavin-dependent oxidoreductase (luciferase family)
MAHLTDHTINAPQLAVAAEARGFDSIFVTEHTHAPALSAIRWREPIETRVKTLRRFAEEAGRDPGSITVAIFGSAGDPTTLDTYLDLGVTNVIIGIDASTLSAAEHQLDHHRPLLDRCRNTP